MELAEVKIMHTGILCFKKVNAMLCQAGLIAAAFLVPLPVNAVDPLAIEDPLHRTGIYVVVGETEWIKPSESERISEKNLFHAYLKINEVIRGPHDLIGQTFQVVTSDVVAEGNFMAITPMLKKGEIAICAIARSGDEKKELHMLSDGPYRIGVDLVPCIKGREMDNFTEEHRNYEVVLQRLRHRRDHPEAYQPAVGKEGASLAPPPQDQPISAAAVFPAKHVPPAVAASVSENVSQSHYWQWGVGVLGIAVVFLLVRKK